ncbi:hypothetical protein ONZ43_g2019 [Nemania bipapillata]|uniref:Uncharacterized protein n=1 Tax=Nemania bipapillata TaxID=110536 RepID=A0ACC2J2K0_9PEZI|nr:hypothetical protein ONZ43_g2019 [Nemania bipapillata]
MDFLEGNSSGREDEMDEGRHFRQELFERIEEIEAAGSFATSGVLDVFPNPGIRVDEELIGLPLVEKEAQWLANRSLKAPFGKKHETLIDETNPRWLEFVNDLVERVAHELGVPPAASESNIRAELYKSLLYEPGHMFKAHKDTEKAPGMFGTLVICLPSKHTGGIVCLQHGDDSMELATAENSEFSCSYLAWYTDVTHEIKPVETGCRWVLTYNLIHGSKSPCPLASVLDSQTQSLVQVLSGWEKLESPPVLMAYRLSHLYTPRSLALSCLKGRDYQRVRCLADSCAKHEKFYLFLAQFDYYKRWPNDEGEDDISDRATLKHVCDLEGSQLSPLCTDMSKSIFLDPVIYDDREPHSRVGGEYTGNQHQDIEETYSDTVALIVPEECVHIPLCSADKGPSNVGALLKHLRTRNGDKANGFLRKVLHHICCMVLKGEFTGEDKEDRYARYYGRPAAPDEEKNDKYFGHAAVAAAYLGDKSLFDKARNGTCRSWEYDCWSELGGLIDIQVPFVDINEQVPPQCHCVPSDVANKLTLFSIVEVVYKSRSFRGVYLALTLFYHGFRMHNPAAKAQAKLEYATQWYSDKLIELITHGGLRDVEARTIMDIVWGRNIQHTPEQRAEIGKQVANLIEKLIHKDNFVHEVAVEILLELSQPERIGPMYLHLFCIILEPAIRAFDFNIWYNYLKTITRRKDEVGFQHKKSPPIGNGGLIRTFLGLAAGYSEDAASRILWKILEQASVANKDVMDEIVLPLMKELLPSTDMGPLESLEVQYCFQLLVKACIAKIAGKEPQKPLNWDRREEVNKCTCGMCARVNAFLEDPDAEQRTIDVSYENTYHVKREFQFLKVDTIEESWGFKYIYTKTLERWEGLYREWARQAELVKEKLQDLPKDKLEQALGSQYDTLMALDVVRLPKRLRDKDPDYAKVAATKRARYDY